ncbi:c-type cytochrome [Kineobactrum salinum]|uniref:cytochrome-c oxidase n=1 Tax=Kineobactrum salinum TaxID=2708301 RepID=A0A6C0TZU4_9GAMM|nr:c-type cytochrome [Kineobactrum salinum]QIB65362.1 c-type cytochrome [Kineobactrum salinum]
MKLVVVLVLLVVGSLLFHWWSPWWFTPLASNWGTVDTTVDITLYITGFVFVAVNLFLAYAVYRYRHKSSRRAKYEPENKSLEIWLTGLTTVGVVAMLAPGLAVWADFTRVPDEADVVEVLGEQWQWSYRFPGEDMQLGEVDSRFTSPDNPFGISPNDPAGADDILVRSADLHLPLDRPVKVLLRSRDVLHNFAVPQFRVKMDMVPGSVSYVWFTPTRTGRFDVMCMELCGIAHYAMRGAVIVDEQEQFDSWLAQQSTWSELQGVPKGDPVAGEAQYAVCASCHGAQGEGNKAMNAPRLAGLSAAYIKRQLEYYQQGIRGAHEDDTYGQQMAPMANVLTSEASVRDVSAYIANLPEQEVEATISGNPRRGASHFNSCGACHGARAQGNDALQAPRLAGQQDWYLKQQLANFRQGIRGTHEQDSLGHQMVMMSRSLQNEKSIDDLLSYLNSL